MPTYKIKYEQNAHQREFHNDTKTFLLHLSCGYGGGKSYALVMKAFQLSRLNRGIRGGCLVPSLPDFKADLLPLFEEILETNRIPYHYHKTEHHFRFPWSTGRMHVQSGEKKLRGPNWGWAIANEITITKKERFDELLGRVRLKAAPNPQIAMSGTPEGTGHFLYEKLILSPVVNSRIIYGDTRDNSANLAAHYIPTLEANYDPTMLDAYLRGLWVNMKGGRFYYAYDPKINDDPRIERIPDHEVWVSLDYNVSPMIATLWHELRMTDDRGRPLLWPDGQQQRQIIAFDQIVIEDGADTIRMAKAFEAHGLKKEETVIFPDPAGRARSTKGPPDNEILKMNGWNRIRVKLVAPQFRKRQLAVNNLLARGIIKINPNKCKALKRDLEAVSQDTATLEKMKDNPKLTHASDGMDYLVDNEFPLSGQKPESRMVRYR